MDRVGDILSDGRVLQRFLDGDVVRVTRRPSSLALDSVDPLLVNFDGIGVDLQLIVGQRGLDQRPQNVA